MSYEFNPTWIILQFMLQTGMVVVFAIFFLPILHDIFLESYLYDNIASPFIKSLVANLWTWSIIIFIAGIAGNVVWLLRAIQAKQAEVYRY